MSPLGLPSFRYIREFHCPDCHGQKAYRSRYRSNLERALLFVLMLKPLRCERCFHRSYALRTVLVVERAPATGEVGNRTDSNSGFGSRVA